MVAKNKNLWSLVLDQQWIDPDDLAAAIRDQIISEDLDFRTRLLIRDGTQALETFWGSERWRKWLHPCPVGERIKSICGEELGKAGFPFLSKQLMEPTRPGTVNQLFRELGKSVHEPIKLVVGGSVALIMPGLLQCQTQVVDVVDEVHQAIRSQHKLLHDTESRYRLQLTHFQSHYLPAGFDKRLHFHDAFGQMQVYLVDPIDVFLSKLFSKRTKDLDDLRALAPQLDKQTIVQRLRETTASLRADESFRQAGEKNWYIVYGEPLPS